MIARVLVATLVAIALSVVCAWAGAASAFEPGTAQSQEAAIVVMDGAALRAAPRDAAQQLVQFSQGELLEVRGERMDYLQVYDHRRERGGWVRASFVRRTPLSAAEAPQLLAVLRFVRDTAGAESLGIGFAAAYLRAAPGEALRGPDGVEAFDALGTLADRLAHRASWGASLPRPAQAALASHLDVAARYGVAFKTFEREGRVQVCYEGDAFRRVLAMEASPGQKARAALALTRPECVPPDLQPLERAQVDAWRVAVLDRVDAASLAPYLRNRIHIRRAAAWSTIAYQRARAGLASADVAAQRALAELAGVARAELPDVDQAAFAEAAVRVNVSRWAADSALPAAAASGEPAIVTVPGQPGETCVLLVDAKNGAGRPLARRCTYALVWPQSATLNREGNALALAVQPVAAWRELWVFRKRGASWTVSVLPPAAGDPEIGYADFAGWVPGGQRMLVAREAQAAAKLRRSYEVVSIDSLAIERSAAEPGSLAVFQRWQDPAWKRMTVSLR